MSDDHNEPERFLGSRYELSELIGAGAMGQVWRARLRSGATGSKKSRGQNQPDLAAKLLRGDLTNDPDVVRRFIQERSLLMGLNHKGIVRVIDMVAEGDRLAIVMEFMPGGSLGDVLASHGTFAPSVAVPMTCAVLDALAYAHQRGVLHRDVKPANVLLGERGLDAPSAAKLSDFGIASFTDERGMHATGLVGSPAYMPPELFSTGTVSAASDVYATGTMLYELLAGRTPFAGSGTMHTVSFRHVTTAPPQLPVDPRLWHVLEAMLAKEPADRLSASGAAEALRSLPNDVIDAPALPVQLEPDWQTVPTLAPKPATRTPIQSVDANVDLGQTRLSGPADAEVFQPRATGKARAVVNTAGQGDDDIAATRLGTIDRPLAQVDTVEEKRKRPMWLIAVGVVVALGVVGGVVVAAKAGVFGGQEETPPTPEESSFATHDWLPAHLLGQAAATGLRIDLEAAPASTVGTAALQLTLTAPRATGLFGDVLLVLPGMDGADCPTLSVSALKPATMSSDDVSQKCAYKLPVNLSSGQSQTVNLQVTGDLGDDLGVWLSAIVDQTTQGLSGVTGAGFPLQRVTGITVQADSTVRTKTTAQVHYRVFAQWSGGEQEIFRDDTLAFQATDLLKALTGGVGLDGVKVSGCPEVQVRGTTVLAQQSASSCFIQVTIGDLESRQATFSINTTGS